MTKRHQMSQMSVCIWFIVEEPGLVLFCLLNIGKSRSSETDENKGTSAVSSFQFYCHREGVDVFGIAANALKRFDS